MSAVLFKPGQQVIHTVKHTYTQKNGKETSVRPTSYVCTVVKQGIKTCLVQFENKVVKTVKLDSLKAFN